MTSSTFSKSVYTTGFLFYYEQIIISFTPLSLHRVFFLKGEKAIANVAVAEKPYNYPPVH